MADDKKQHTELIVERVFDLRREGGTVVPLRVGLRRPRPVPATDWGMWHCEVYIERPGRRPRVWRVSGPDSLQVLADALRMLQELIRALPIEHGSALTLCGEEITESALRL